MMSMRSMGIGRRLLLLSADFPANLTGYVMSEAELRVWAQERVAEHLRQLGGGALDLSLESIAAAVKHRGWRLWRQIGEHHDS